MMSKQTDIIIVVIFIALLSNIQMNDTQTWLKIAPILFTFIGFEVAYKGINWIFNLEKNTRKSSRGLKFAIFISVLIGVSWFLDYYNDGFVKIYEDISRLEPSEFMSISALILNAGIILVFYFVADFEFLKVEK